MEQDKWQVFFVSGSWSSSGFPGEEEKIPMDFCLPGHTTNVSPFMKKPIGGGLKQYFLCSPLGEDSRFD